MEIRNVEEKKTLAVNLTAPASELPNVIGEVYGEIGAYLGRKGIEMTGAPYVLYRNMDMDALDLEIGFPAGGNDQGEGRIKPSRLPAGRVVTAIHKGPYKELEKTYEKVMAYIAAEGVKTTEWMYESYLNSPMDTAEEELLTELFFPLAE